MDQEIKDIISKNLPAQVGDVLRARLEQASKDAADSKIHKDELARVRLENRQLDVRIIGLEADLKRAGDIDAREAAVTKREQAVELTLAQARAENAEKNTAALMTLVGSVFRNTTARESIFKSENVQVTQPGGYVTQMPQNSNVSISREVE